MLIGLVGAPNVGKSTFFKAATLADVLIANYPFATIKPNHGVAYVRIDCIDKELGAKCNPREGYCVDGQRFVPCELMDVAGLVPDASKGKGLGNQFLDDLRQADAFIQIVDLSGKNNEEGKAVDDYYPGNSIAFLEKELDLWYLGILKKVWPVFVRTAEMQKQNFAQAVTKQFSGLKVTEDDVKKVLLKTGLDPLHPTKWSDDELMKFSNMLRSLTKPMIIVGNKIDSAKGKENYDKIKKDFSYEVIPVSAESELALREASKNGIIDYVPGDKDFIIKDESKLTDKQRMALKFVKEKILDVYGSTGVQKVLNMVVFDLLKYIAVFPAGTKKLADSKGNILPDCYLIPSGSTALDFAFKLHTDLGKNFIRAIDVRTKQTVGKDHKLKNRDGIEIVT
ncbi:MAG: redox-regulated ATPase YchF [Nanoarchaeota archaeon]